MGALAALVKEGFLINGGQIWCKGLLDMGHIKALLLNNLYFETNIPKAEQKSFNLFQISRKPFAKKRRSFFHEPFALSQCCQSKLKSKWSP